MKTSQFTAFLFVAVCSTLRLAGGDTMLKTGDTAPDFALASSNGDTIRLSGFSGSHYVVLVFYPGDETPGCTKQLCAVRDDYSKFEAKNVKVFGVNPADSTSHRKFVKRYSFQFPLLIDQGRKTAKQYGCDGGLFVKRTVFIIDPKGVIIYAKRGMPSDEEILKAIPEQHPDQ
jgi:thioredoxin-dependent peroxiredoxin